REPGHCKALQTTRRSRRQPAPPPRPPPQAEEGGKRAFAMPCWGLIPPPQAEGGAKRVSAVALPGFAPSPACGGTLGRGRSTRGRPVQAAANPSKIAPPACPPTPALPRKRRRERSGLPRLLCWGFPPPQAEEGDRPPDGGS